MAKLKVYNISLKLNNIVKFIAIILVLIFSIKLIANKVQAIHETGSGVTISENKIELNQSNTIKNVVSNVSIDSLKGYFEKTLAIFSPKNENNNVYVSVKNILKYELGTFNKIVETEAQRINEKDLTSEDKAELLEYSEVQTEVQESAVQEKFSDEVQSVKIKNSSDYEITDDLISEIQNNDYTYSRNVMIYHTHTCESYTQEVGFEYATSGNYRTTDLNFSVSRVGDELEKNLKNLKFNVIHDKTYHDFPAYSGSYDRAYNTVQNLVEQNKNYEIIFDIHRDAVGSDGAYAPTVKIGDEYAAQLMFVIGTDAGGLEHPNWRQNLSFAFKVQKKANELYPGLFKPIMLSNSRFNQNLGNGACIIEVGATR